MTHPTLIVAKARHQTQTEDVDITETELWATLEEVAEEDDENPDNGDYNAS